MKIHPAAEGMPLMTDGELDSLVLSIRERGLLDPIILCDGMILDGRHRFLACERAGVEPRFAEFSGDNPWLFVWDKNGERRHFRSAEQKVVVFMRYERLAADFARERAAVAAAANAARSEAAREGRVGRASTKQKAAEFSGGSDRPATKPAGHPTRKAVAVKLGVSESAVKRAEQLQNNRPDLAAQVAAGEVAANAAVKRVGEDARKESLERPVRVSVEGLHRGDFRELAALIPDDSVELVFTDPPYDRESLPLYEAAAKEAARILKPGGSMICYVGQVLLPEVLPLMAKHLRYWWTAACVHEGGNQMMQKLGIRCGWKPMLWFVKGTRGDVAAVLRDTVSGSREKHAHEWQQAESEAEHFIAGLTSQSGVVVDFFAGGGTTCAVAQRLGRKWVAFEIDARHYESAAGRLGRKAAA